MRDILNGSRWSQIVTLDGGIHEGPWTFTSDGAGCMYPRFVHDDGNIVAWHAAQGAVK